MSTDTFSSTYLDLQWSQGGVHESSIYTWERHFLYVYDRDSLGMAKYVGYVTSIGTNPNTGRLRR